MAVLTILADMLDIPEFPTIVMKVTVSVPESVPEFRNLFVI